MRNMGIKSRWVYLIILVLAFIVYANSLNNSFHYDDKFYIKDNFYIRDTGNIPASFRHPSYLSVGTPSGHYRPLLFTSYAINYYFDGLNPIGYRLVNLAFHTGSAILVFLIINAMSGSFYIAIAAALIFAVHPFNSEVVNFISTRSSVMSAFFYLLAFWCWVKYRIRTNIPIYITSILAFLLGMLTKETVITLPIVLWLYDLYFIPGRNGIVGHARRLVAHVPFVLIIATTYFAVHLFHWGSFIPNFKRDIFTQFYTEMPVLAKQIRLLFIPAGLNADHYVTIYNDPVIPVTGSLIFLILVIAIAIWLYRSPKIEWRVVSFFILWFFITLLPTTIMPLNAILQENRGYLAGLGFAMFAGIILYKITTLGIFNRWSGRYIYIFPVTGLALTLLVYSIGTIERNTVWRDGISLWKDAVMKSPLSYRAHHNLAYSFEEAGEVKLAIREYQRVIEIDPSSDFTYYNLGRLYRGVGLTEDAIKAYREAVRINPGYYNVYNNLGIVYNDRGMYDQAIEEFKKAVTINPGYIMARMNLGKLYEKTGRMDLAANEFMAVINLVKPGSDEEKKAYEAARHIEWIKGITREKKR